MGMGANELRIRNLFKDREGRICRVESIHEDFEECDILSVEGAITALPVEPIPLTDEWLVKFGFEKESDFIFSIDRFIVFKNLYNNVLGLNTSDFYTSTGIGFQKHLEHVHTLQNLYFALTGEELKFEKR